MIKGKEIVKYIYVQNMSRIMFMPHDHIFRHMFKAQRKQLLRPNVACRINIASVNTDAEMQMWSGRISGRPHSTYSAAL